MALKARLDEIGDTTRASPLEGIAMKVGINGMGRIGRLALSAAFGGMHRPAGDPRAANRLDVVHVNELKGGAAATAHLLEFDSIHGRWHDIVRRRRTITQSRIGERQHRLQRGRLAPARCRGAISAATSCSNAPASS